MFHESICENDHWDLWTLFLLFSGWDLFGVVVLESPWHGIEADLKLSNPMPCPARLWTKNSLQKASVWDSKQLRYHQVSQESMVRLQDVDNFEKQVYFCLIKEQILFRVVGQVGRTFCKSQSWLDRTGFGLDAALALTAKTRKRRVRDKDQLRLVMNVGIVCIGF